MPRPRKSLINLNDTSYYHCTSRCVRRAFLCGKDKQTGKSYEHRRQWVEDRLLLLADVFCVDVCAYAVMTNHTHVVLRINKSKANSLSDSEVIRRWHKLYKGMVLARRYLIPAEQQTLSEAEIETVKSLAQVYRHRLYDISWFMRLLNEYIARQANKEDDCTGHFWEGRFKSQALMDEAALAACMAYVDLNPIRAGIADTLETSSHTSIKMRIVAAEVKTQPAPLLSLKNSLGDAETDALPFHIEDYLGLVEVTGGYFHPEKRGKISQTTPGVLSRLGLNTESWQTMVTGIESAFATSISIEELNRRRSRLLANRTG